MFGISLLGLFFIFNRKFLTETKRPGKLVPSKVYLMWIRQRENKKSQHHTAPQCIYTSQASLKPVVIHPSMDLCLLA